MTKQVTPPPPGDKPAPTAPPSPPRWRHWLLILTALGFAVQVITYSTSFLEDQALITNAYYDSKLNYRMSYDPVVSQTKRLIEYVNGKPAAVGLGFDRWFVFLHKLRVSARIEFLIAALLMLLILLSLNRLTRLMRADWQAGPEVRAPGMAAVPS